MPDTSSTFLKKISRAVFFVWPARNDVVSEPVRQWKARSDKAVSGCGFQAVKMDCTSVNFGFLLVPDYICTSFLAR